jgi:hypothetical protein
LSRDPASVLFTAVETAIRLPEARDDEMTGDPAGADKLIDAERSLA